MEAGNAVAHDWSADRLLGTPLTSSRALEFEDVYGRFFDEVRRWIRALGGPEADRDDLAQDVFLIVHRCLPAFDGENLPGWLYQITRRRVRDFRQLRWFRLFLAGARADESLVSPNESPEAALRSREEELMLTRLLAKLPEAQRAAFVLFEIEGYSGEEIARLQGVPINTVWARVHKARVKLAISLERAGEGRAERRVRR
ncbi:MAG: sigma-70 family RNA polymerase sigma factor [Polyangiaceae bacterium]|jgi:RNA polymerase sigma-70 factor (ECF subfamily)